MSDVRMIVDDVMAAFGVATRMDLADELGETPVTIANWNKDGISYRGIARIYALAGKRRVPLPASFVAYAEDRLEANREVA